MGLKAGGGVIEISRGSDNLAPEDSHSGRVRASRTRVDESLEGSNPSSSAGSTSLKISADCKRTSDVGATRLLKCVD